ncbi:peptidoglycan-binding domain-containing protein [Neptunomonas sp. XY-337]|uniref:peptidoglycan-binding domain-containing protein n=1 Tax=Neptunomonas sp. XY-337 TaxID=2561897 RepID=UPI00197FCEEA|nr:peptidoglycan-binding domain-containing protein [Neptunomonas sp. XY-337]
MAKSKQVVFKLSVLSAAVLMAACSSNNTKSQLTEAGISAEQLEARQQQLLEREKQLTAREARAENALQKALASSKAVATGNEPLLPPNAKPGECYARVWVEPSYEHYTETVLAKEASERVEVIPARFETVSQRVEVAPASYRIETVPAQYRTVKERKLVKESGLRWLVDRAANSAPASQELLNAARAHGINLDAAKPGMCFHEHYTPAKYETVTEAVLVQDAYEKVSTTPAKYRWVEKQVLVQDATTRIEQVPAKYKTVTEQVIDKPAHTTWKKGTGPIQKIDSATGEIMCLVEVPATYKTITKRVLVAPATTRTVNVPAKYDTVRVKELVAEASEQRHTVAAKYKDVPVKRKVSDVEFVWHEVHNKEHPSSTRTGNKICLTETPAQYKTITRQEVVREAQSRKVEIPAQYKTVKVTREVSPAQEKRIEIPAEYATVSRSKLKADGFMEWRSILCETNMTPRTVMNIQRALKAKGFNPGAVDGIVGSSTVRAINDFQRKNNLPVDKYINIDTVKALQVEI